MRLDFRARAVAFEHDTDSDVAYLVLAEHHDGSGCGLEIQRALEFDRQDKELGQDTYCLVADGGVTHYGGVRRWELDESTLSLELDAGAAQTLGWREASVAIPDASRQRVQAAMRQLLA